MKTFIKLSDILHLRRDGFIICLVNDIFYVFLTEWNNRYEKYLCDKSIKWLGNLRVDIFFLLTGYKKNVSK